jgi:hypothetical protein
VAEEKLAQKKDEREKEIKRNNQNISYECNSSNTKVEFMDFFNSIFSNQSLLDHFSKS